VYQTLIFIKWSPDACWCLFEVQIIQQGNNDVLDLVKVIEKCLEHENMGDIGAFNSAFNKQKAFNQKPQLPNETHDEWFGRIAQEKLNARKVTKRP